MSWIKLLFLLLPLAINVKAVEIINKSYGSELNEPRWFENSTPTPYGNRQENATHFLVETLDSPKNFSPIPLRSVPKPISYGSYGIPKVIHTTPQYEAKHYSMDPSSEKYSLTVSGAPLRSVIINPPTMKREERTHRDNVVKADPKAQDMKNMAQNTPRNEIREYESSRKQNNMSDPLPQVRSIGREIQIVESTSSAPLRNVPKPYVYYEVPKVKESVTHPSHEEKLENISRMPLVSKPTMTAPVLKHKEDAAVKKIEEPKVNVKVVEVTSKPMSTPVNDKNRFVEHFSPVSMPDSSRFSSLTELPTTVTVMHPTESVSRMAYITVPPQTDMTMSNSTPTMLQKVKELRLDFTCDGINAFFSIAKSCDKFVECKDDVAKLYRCPPGLHFNPKTVWPAEPCEDKYIVGCDKSLTPPTAKPNLIIITRQLVNYNCVKGDGYYEHESNCGLFIECKNNVATLYGCPSGWHFNNSTRYGENPCDIPATEKCHKPESKFSATIVSRRVADYVCSSSSGYFKINNECEHFIKCERWIASSYKCFAGLQFNQHALWGSDPCASASEIRCQAVMPAAPKFSAVLVIRMADYYCPSSNGYYRMNDECEQFIKCENSIASTYKCFPGLQYNHNAAWGEDPCAGASVVRCRGKIIPPEPKFSAILIGRMEGYTCLTNRGYYKRDDSCEEFIKCEQSIAFSYKCFSGLQFNHNAEWGEDPCASESIIRCHAAIILPAPTFSAVLIARMEKYVCPSSSGYFKLENDCEQFIKCERSVASKYKCLSGYQYNHNAIWGEDPCASESIVRCHAKIIPPAPTFSAILISRMENYVCPTSNGYFRLENDCEQFVKCERSVPLKFKCFSGMQFNHNAAWGHDPCASESIVRCHAKIIPPAPTFSAVLISRMENYVCPSSNGYFRLENDCEQFVKCERSVALKFKCFSGMQFNHSAAWGQDPCASESMIRCHAVIIPPPPKFSAVFITIIDGFVCPSSNGYYRVTDNCEQFIKCERSIASTYKCYYGLQYNHNAAWGEDPCASESIIRCRAKVLPPEPKFSANLIGRLEGYNCPSSQGYYKHENKCEEFIKCEQSIAFSYKCFSGLQFNHNAEWGNDPCASESIIRCHAAIIPPAPTFSAVLIARMENYVCPSSSGYFKLENDCEQFVKCERSVPMKFKCFSGMQFNHNAAWGHDPCASESIVRCHAKIIPPAPTFSAVLISRMENYVCPSSNGYFRLENDCEQFVKCERSVALKFKCFSGMQFNHSAAWGQDPCASESMIRCRAVIIPPPPKFSAVFIARLDGFVCPSSNGYYRVTDNCEQFIKCERSIASTYKCYSGLQYNHNAAWGEDPCASESIIRCRPAPKFSATLVARLENYVCPAGNGYHRLATNDCEQFIKCENSLASSYKCYTGLRFNQNARWGEDPCALPAIAHCEIEVSSVILITPHIDHYTCEAANGYFRKPDDCEQFIKCERNLPSLYTCPAGFQFNPKSRWGEYPCASASVVRCQVKVLSYTLITKYINGFTCPARTGYYKVKDQCEQFIMCQNNVPSLYMCKNGLHFNRYVAWGADPCAIKSVARCEHYKPKTPIDHDAMCPHPNGYFPLDDSECSKYVVCENGIATVMPCPSGLVFNATLEACDWPVNVPSCNPNVFEGFSCPPPMAKDGTYDEEITHFRYRQSCKAYIACQEGRPRLLSCDPGRYFDEETRHCIDSSLVHNCKENE